MSHNTLELMQSSPNWTDKHSLYTLFKIDYMIFITEILKLKRI